MLEDLFYELLPVVGFAVLASSVFVTVIMRMSQGAFKFVLFLAAADIFFGITLIVAGFHGVLTTIYGTTGEMIKPLDCVLTRTIHLPMEVFSDALHSVILLWFGTDRLLQMLLPVQYVNIAAVYINWPVFFLVVLASGGATIPSLQYPIQNRDNLTGTISPLCRFEEVFGEDYFSDHMWAVQWAPLIGLGMVAMSLIVFGIRSTKQRWTYNWSENGTDTVQLTAACIIRCLMAAIAIHLPLLLLSSYPAEENLTDVIIRITFALCLPILQPLYYLLTMPIFTHNVRMIFNKYSHNTKRTWQSAADPPKSDDHVDPHGDQNPFGSWYSSAGNVIGEAGVPTEERAGIERSVSFYYREETSSPPDNENERSKEHHLTVEKPPQQMHSRKY